jgi:hypothetical protein
MSDEDEVCAGVGSFANGDKHQQNIQKSHFGACISIIAMNMNRIS